MPADQTKASTRLHLAIFGAFFVFGYQQGAKQIHDNGTFTHLRTGIDMAKSGAIPRTDPYTFTARGHAWTVQSWLPEWTYGWAYRIGGYKFVIFEQAVLIGVLVRVGRSTPPPKVTAYVTKSTPTKVSLGSPI